ncbi:hypothetical protein HZA40_04300 [Candidatus Peregrinibacteria bacterium]|nr:hypothetical protein [Candidatus Peregrinibacteria bacterium]
MKIKDWFKRLIPRWEPSLFLLVKKEKKTTKEFKEILSRKMDSLWYSKGELALVIILFFVFVITSHLQSAFDSKWIFGLDVVKRFLLSKDSSHYQNLIAIHTGIGAVLIGIAFFIAQELVKNDAPYKGIILLRRSRFFTLLVAEVLFFFQFLWGSVNALSVVPIILIGYFTIKSLYEAIKLLANNFVLKKEEEALFYQVIKINFLKILDSEITKRIGNNKLYEWVGRFEGIMDASPFSPMDEDKYFPVEAKNGGFVADINFNRLKKLVTKFSTTNFNDQALLVDSTSQTTQNKRKLEPPCRLVPFFHTNLKDYRNKLFWIRMDVLRAGFDKKSLTSQVRKIFTIKPEFDLESAARDEVLKLKIRCINAIQSLKTDELHKLVMLYIDLIKEFYAMLQLYGGGFSQEQAEKERGSFLVERLKPLEWLSKDVRDIFERAMESKDVDIIREIAYLPMIFAQQAVENRDHLIFQEFLYFPQLLYLRACEEQKSGNDRLAKIMFDCTSRYLKELSDYHLGSKLKKNEFPEDDFKGFAIHILKVFQTLLKETLDNQDIINFRAYLSVTKKLFKDLANPYGRAAANNAEAIFEFLDKKRKEMLFGLATWIFFLFERNKDTLKLKEFYNEIKNALPSDIVNFTDVFLDAHNFEAERSWGWDNWEMSMKEEGEVHCIQILEKLERFYAVNALSLIRAKTDAELQQIELPHNRDMAFLAEGTRDLNKTIQDIEANPDNWKFVLDENSIGKTSGLKSLLNKARVDQEEDDLRRKRNTNIAGEKVEKFKKGLLLSYSQSHPIKAIFKKYGLYEDNTDKSYSGAIKKNGINTMFDKAPFFGDEVSWHVHFVGHDEAFGFGRGMAYGENEQMLEKLISNCQRVNREDFETTILSFKTSNLLLIATNHASWTFFEQLGNYIPHWHPNFPKDRLFEGAEGVMRLKNLFVPVYQVFTPNAEKSEVLILDKTKLGKVIQYSPLDKKDQQTLKYDVFLIDVQEFSPDSVILNEFLKNPPPWLKKISTEEKRKEHLQEEVLIHIYQRSEFVLNKKFHGHIMEVNERI